MLFYKLVDFWLSTPKLRGIEIKTGFKIKIVLVGLVVCSLSLTQSSMADSKGNSGKGKSSAGSSLKSAWVNPATNSKKPTNLSSKFFPAKIGTLDVTNAVRYYRLVILSFADAETQALAEGNPVRRFASFERVARRKLRQLEIAGRLDDLRIPPGNHLEKLRGDREGQMSIRINDKWRLCFTWTTSGARDVEIVDYH